MNGGKILIRIISVIAFITVIGLSIPYILFGIICGGGFSDGGSGVGFLIFMILILLIAILRFIFYLTRDKSEENNLEIEVENTELKQPIAYIYIAKKNHLNDREIRNNLKLTGGWSDQEIDQSFKEYYKKH